MSALNFDTVHPVAAERVAPFLEELCGQFPDLIRAAYITGSAVTPDFNERTSDVNSLLILQDIPIDLLDAVARLGRTHGKRQVRAPLLMTARDIERSRDVFPVEFLDLKLVNHLATGEDLLADLTVQRADMRLQCERELKGRILRLRQDYIQALGDRRLLRERLVGSLAGLIALLRGTLHALGRPTPRERAGILSELRTAADCDTAPFEAVIRLKSEQEKPPLDKLVEIFKAYYETMGKLADVIDAAN